MGIMVYVLTMGYCRIYTINRKAVQGFRSEGSPSGMRGKHRSFRSGCSTPLAFPVAP